jgi:hypothetical protein
MLDHHVRSVPSNVAWKDISEEVVEDMIQLLRAGRRDRLRKAEC